MHPGIIKDNVYIFELSLDKIILKVKPLKFKEASIYPSITKDMAFIVKNNITSKEIIDTIKKTGGRLLDDVRVFDVYKGDKINDDEVSLAFSLTFKDDTRTLTDSEATLLGKTCTGLKIISDIHKIPVVGVVQARRRNSEKREDEELLSDKESVYNSLQVTQVATRMVSLNQVANALKLLVAKNRYGKEGMTYTYSYDYDRLLFTYIPSLEDINNDDETKKETKEIQKGFKNIF